MPKPDDKMTAKEARAVLDEFCDHYIRKLRAGEINILGNDDEGTHSFWLCDRSAMQVEVTKTQIQVVASNPHASWAGTSARVHELWLECVVQAERQEAEYAHEQLAELASILKKAMDREVSDD
jgi:hypothetical protein